MRYLAWAGMALVLWPLLPGLVVLVWPARESTVWQALAADGQFGAALAATVLSAFGATVLALSWAAWVAMRLYPQPSWNRLQQRLPTLLALPHAAFAIGLVFLFAPSGWLARWLALVFDWAAPPAWVTVQDPWGISLMLALALKESWFLLWVFSSLLAEQVISKQLLIAHSLGYNRAQAWSQVLWPQLLPRLAWPLLAVLAYGLSVVDMALILGPSTPPTLAVLAWQWFAEPAALAQAKAGAVAVILFGLLLLGILGWQASLWLWRRRLTQPRGRRRAAQAQGSGSVWLFLQTVPGWAVVAVLLLWSVAASWFFPALWPSSWTLTGWLQTDFKPVFMALGIGLSAVALALPIVLFWLEAGGKQEAWVYLPLILPALPLAAAQYRVLLHLHADGTLLAVIWAHLAWVVPYMLLVLQGAYRAVDARYVLTAKALGYNAWQACLWVKWPLLLRPILAAMAVGFAVSIAQYLPTLFAGGGRIETVTTEAVALSAGGNRRVTAVHALLQAALPLMLFALAGLMGRFYVRRHQGVA